MNLYNLHKMAGLVEGGRNDEGDIEWIGTDAQWERLNKLEKYATINNTKNE